MDFRPQNTGVNSTAPSLRSIACRAAAALVACGLVASSFAAQVITPVRVGVPGELTAYTQKAGTTLFFDVNYSFTGSQTKDEAGLGLRIQYDSTKFDVVVPATNVSNLLTKCMIASPSDQLVSGNTREVIFGWLDTSVRTVPAAGAVGWPGTTDPAAAGATNGCLNPGGIVTTIAAVSSYPTTLFRFGIRSKTSFTSGTSNINIQTSGNISYAAAGNTDTAKTVVVTGDVAPACNLELDGVSPIADAATDGMILYRSMFGLSDLRVESPRAAGSTRTAAQINADVVAMGAALDIDGNGLIDAASDGIAIRRAMLGLSDFRVGVPLPSNSPIYNGGARTVDQVGAEVKLILAARCGFVAQ